MKKLPYTAVLLALACLGGAAQAQNAAPVTQEFQYPSQRSKTAACRRLPPCA